MTLGSANSTNRRGKLKLWRIKQLQNSGGESFASTEVEESFDETEELELDQQATTTTTSATVCEFVSAQVDKGVFVLFVLLQVLRPKRKKRV